MIQPLGKEKGASGLVVKTLALDQSSYTTGYAIFDDDKPIVVGHFTVSGTDLGVRLEKIRNKVQSLIEENDIDYVIFEDIQLQEINGSRTAGIKTFKMLAEVFGVIKELLTEMKMPHDAVLPIVWKATFKIAGKGREKEKKLAQETVLTTYSIHCTEDEADATLIGAHAVKQRQTEMNWS